ncbi:hypothetical protein SY83_18380 [Paenibacillus swuensis]|uniref:Phosphate transport regulator n=1 Tax=Paenibacillus swuensis TaxID=1178515 RepID=A0A172TLZ7_9BACL|nr:DUF47 family protein [Paenibacillus swuensis]ANE47934.1 hypothetical protein SY83_18380 [Paenibacillus swuensis]
MFPFNKKSDVNYLNYLIMNSENALKCAQLFRNAMMGTKPPAEHQEEIKELESKGDSLTHEIYKGLNAAHPDFLKREDILELATRIDDVLDGIEASIARFDYLGIDFTDNYMKDFSEVLVQSCEHILTAMKLLSERKFVQMREHIVIINSMENDADRIMREGIRQIFSNPTDPYTDFKLKEIYERLEETTDDCENVADILESIVLRYA